MPKGQPTPTTLSTGAAALGPDWRHQARVAVAGHVAQGFVSRENIEDEKIPARVVKLTDAIVAELARSQV